MVEAEFEELCLTCEYRKVDINSDPCCRCLAYSCWEKRRDKSADECIKEWEESIYGSIK